MSAATTIELTTPHDGKISQVRRSHEHTLEQSTEIARTSSVVEKKGTTAFIITTIAGVTMISSLLSGIVTIALPVMAKDLEISQALLFW